jgi:hypothetical protein
MRATPTSMLAASIRHPGKLSREIIASVDHDQTFQKK